MRNNSQKLGTALADILREFPNTREAMTYLERFGTAEAHRFAIIKLGGGVLEQSLDAIITSVSFMYSMGLTPILVHGAGPQLDAVLGKMWIKTKKIDGVRVTPPEAMGVVRKVMYQQSNELQDKLEANGVRARTFQHGIFECDFLDEERFGMVGKIREIHLDAIKRAIQNGSVPIITPLGESKSGQVLNINADTATRFLAKNIQPSKTVFLTLTGGLLDGNKKVISAINLETDFEDLKNQPWLDGGMRLKLQEIKELLEGLPSSASVSITSAKHLTKELFTHRGAGTLVRRGEKIISGKTMSDEEIDQANSLLETCFGRKIDPEILAKLAVKEVFWSTSRRALAVIVEGVDGLPYLDKFAVTPEAQGEGLGAAIWVKIREHYPQLYWRSRAENQINTWYLKQADSMMRSNGWLVMSYGIENPAILKKCQQDVLTRKISWVDGS